jgi:hypothetical protein
MNVYLTGISASLFVAGTSKNGVNRFPSPGILVPLLTLAVTDNLNVDSLKDIWHCGSTYQLTVSLYSE